uniref:Roc domain-containing protein n=2 Tax=Clastoptera arizonana TaxID=38151 RepID=A0A1B6DYK5_9HEMI
MTRLLVASGANLGSIDCSGETALIHAARHGHANQVNLLITAGACISKPNKEGDSALHVASAWGHVDCITILVENGALVDAVNLQGSTSLHVALTRKHVNVGMVLLHAAGADYEIQDEAGETALHIAVREGLLSIVQTLCTLGCSVDLPNKQGLYPIHLAARYGHIDIVRCLCLAGCNTEVRNVDGVKAEITALKHGHVDISNLLSKVKDSYSRDNFIRQLIPNTQSIPRFNVHIFGHSGVGKSTLVETLKTGYFSSFFRRNKPLPSNNPRSQPNSPSKVHIEMDLTSRRNSLSFDLYNYQYTRGIDLQQVNLSGVGDVSLWDFSGQDTYFCVYHHLMTTSANNAVILLVFSLEDTLSIQKRQCNFWLSFIQSRIPPTEPIGIGGVTANMPRVVLIATHADTSRTPRSSQGEYQNEQVQQLAQSLAKTYAATFHFHSSVIIIDAHAANSAGIKAIKNCLSEIKSKMVQEEPQMTGFCEAVLAWLPSLRKSAQCFPVVSWEGFMDTIRLQINPLAGEENFRELLTQLQHMGEIVYLKSCIHPDLLVITPSWLCGQVIGQLLSIDFLAHARITGCYTVDDFQAAFPQVDAMAMLQVLETLQLCIQCENDGELEYEFPCYNLVETLEGLWEENDPRYRGDGCYGGVRLYSPQGTLHLLHSVFPRIQVELRRTVINYCDSESDLYQWFRGSKLCSGLIESLITLEVDEMESIEIKVRGPANTEPICFFFIEEILGIIDQVLVEMCPGLAIEKHIISVEDLRSHCVAPYCYPPDVLMKAMLEDTCLDTQVHNPLADCQETLFDLIAFGSNEVKELIIPVDELSVGCLSTVCRQQLCSLLDPLDPHGRDWCLLAVQLGLQDKLSAIESRGGSQTANMLDLWAAEKSSLGLLIRKLISLGRYDAASILLRSAPLYKIVPELSPPQETPSDCSNNISR